MKTLLCAAFAALVSTASVASGAIIAEYEFTGNSLSPTTQSPNVIVSALSTVSTTSGGGSGFINDGPLVTPSGNPQYSQTGFADGGYFTFTVQAAPGYQLSLTNLEFYQRLGSEGSNRTYTLQYLIDGGSPVQFGSGDASTLNYTERNGALSIVDEIGLIEIRILGSISNDATTFRIDDVLLEGTVTAVPEPSGMLLGGFGLLACWAAFRGRRSRAV